MYSLATIDALKPSSKLTKRTMKSRTGSISTARFRQSSTSPNATARTQEAREAGMSVSECWQFNGDSPLLVVLTSLQNG